MRKRANNNLQQLYDEVKIKYTQFIAITFEENKKLVHYLHTRSTQNSYCNLQIVIAQKSVLPYIQSDPKTNFLTYTKINLFTKDNSMFKYKPNIQIQDLKYQYEYSKDIVNKPLLFTTDIINLIFLKIMHYNLEAHEFLRIPYTIQKPKSFQTFFCNTCLLFNCGIHKITPGKCLHAKEVSECICSDTNSIIHSNDYTESYVNNNEIVQKVGLLDLKPCVLVKIVQMLNGPKINCDVFSFKNLPPIKKIDKNYKETLQMEYFVPCNHNGPCNKKTCTCVQKNISCELSCFCANCTRMKFCNCTNACQETCLCRRHGRFCDPNFCGCTQYCDCTNKYTTKYKKTTIFKSIYHGFGLFSNEDIIRKGEYVIEYTGEIVSDGEAERRGYFYEMNNLSYLFNMANKGVDIMWSIDAFQMGNESRYINHSVTDANLKTSVKIDKGINKIILYAIRDIYKGEELLFDYKFTEEYQRKHGMISD